MALFEGASWIESANAFLWSLGAPHHFPSWILSTIYAIYICIYLFIYLINFIYLFIYLFIEKTHRQSLVVTPTFRALELWFLGTLGLAGFPRSIRSIERSWNGRCQIHYFPWWKSFSRRLLYNHGMLRFNPTILLENITIDLAQGPALRVLPLEAPHRPGVAKWG